MIGGGEHRARDRMFGRLDIWGLPAARHQLIADALGGAVETSTLGIPHELPSWRTAAAFMMYAAPACDEPGQ